MADLSIAEDKLSYALASVIDAIRYMRRGDDYTADKKLKQAEVELMEAVEVRAKDRLISTLS